MKHAALVVLMLLATASAGAQDLGDKAAGLRLAQAWCTECHQVVEGRTETSPLKPPSFFTIANRAEVTPVWLHAFFRTPHPVMPNIIITPTEGDDLAAYILGMKR